MDCHAFEFMQRALQDLRKTAASLDARVRRGTAAGGGEGVPHSGKGARRGRTRTGSPRRVRAWPGRCWASLPRQAAPPHAAIALQTETLLLQAERRALCACWPSGR